MMIPILLDTNVISELMRPEPDRLVLEWFSAHEGRIFYISAVSQAEVLLGISLLPPGKRHDALARAAHTIFEEVFAGRILPFDAVCAAHFAGIVSSARLFGTNMTMEDAQIAAIARAKCCMLATRNTKDFSHVDTLQLCNPWQPLG